MIAKTAGEVKGVLTKGVVKCYTGEEKEGEGMNNANEESYVTVTSTIDTDRAREIAGKMLGVMLDLAMGGVSHEVLIEKMADCIIEITRRKVR